MTKPTIRDVMEAYAKEAEAIASEHGCCLDYSERSLEQVDALLEAVTGGEVLVPASDDAAERLWTLSKQFGSYVGQVVIKNLGGEWESQPTPTGGVVVLLRCDGIQAFPMDKVFKRLTQDKFSGVAGYVRAMRAIQRNQTMQAGMAGPSKDSDPA